VVVIGLTLYGVHHAERESALPLDDVSVIANRLRKAS